MSAELVVFVSHSSGDNGLVRKLMPLLKSGLGEAWDDASVLVDLERLPEGKNWNARIGRLLWQCNAALLLLTRDVLNRPDWVRKETNFLAVRAETDPTFTLWVAYAPDITQSEIDAVGFGPAGLQTIQRLKTELTLANLAPLVAELCTSLPATKANREVVEPVVAHLERLLRRQDARSLCSDFAKRLRLEEIPTSWGEDQVAWVAAATARGVVGRRLGRLDIGKLVDGLYFEPDHKQRVLEWLTPLWIRSVAAKRLLQYAPGGAGQGRSSGTLTIPGKLIAPFTGEMFVRRAFGVADGFKIWRVSSVAGGDTYPGICASICAHARTTGWVDSTLGIEAVVKELERFGQPIFVSLEVAPDQATSDQLRDNFPGVLFLCPALIASGDDGFSDVPPIEALPGIGLDADEDLAIYEATERLEYDGWRRHYKTDPHH